MVTLVHTCRPPQLHSPCTTAACDPMWGPGLSFSSSTHVHAVLLTPIHECSLPYFFVHPVFLYACHTSPHFLTLLTLLPTPAGHLHFPHPAPPMHAPRAGAPASRPPLLRLCTLAPILADQGCEFYRYLTVAVFTSAVNYGEFTALTLVRQ